MADPHNLDRFVQAQQGIYAEALDELRRGLKRSHWMWFIFPQAAGLGRSAMAQRYAIASVDEARAYLAHPLLGPRLEECTRTLLTHEGAATEAILGPIDALKLRSSMTLFAAIAGPDAPFASCLKAFFAGQPDPATLAYLEA